MPTYEYICTECSHEFEAFQSIRDEALKECPQCQGKLRKKISGGAGLLFKGSGFYITDYKKQKPSKPSVKESKKTAKKAS